VDKNEEEEDITVDEQEEPVEEEVEQRSPCQPIGKHCLVIGRTSSPKGLTSKKLKNGKRVQIDYQGMIDRRLREGEEIARCQAQNCPQPFQWDKIQATSHKKSSYDKVDWQTDRGGQAAMVVDIDTFLRSIPHDSEFTICMP
jgi:tRNA U34 5-carboxymethylaminomethyl modifying enzyme MnmG/GidA